EGCAECGLRTGRIRGSAVQVTEHTVPERSPTVLVGSMNCDRPGSITRMMFWFGARAPSATNDAVAVVVVGPRFWMMIGVTKPKKRRVTFGRKMLFAPPEKPSYDMASARSDTPWCSFTTLTTVEPYE